MRNRFLLSALLFQGALLPILAQTSYDVFPVMEQELEGTARYIGMGGAMGAFGSDLSVISRNPAGIGTYHDNDASISLAFSGSNTGMVNPGTLQAGAGNISYSGDLCRSDLLFYLQNISSVAVMPVNGSSLKYVNFALSYHRMRDMERSLRYFDEYHEAGKPVEYRDLADDQSIRINAFDFNVSFNHNDRFYWGATLERQRVNVYTSGHFYHYFPVPAGQEAEDYTSVDRANELVGTGWNFKMGMIARPGAGGLRFGLSFSTPTFYRLEHTYYDKLYAIEGEKKDAKKFSQTAFYNLSSPWVVNASFGYSGKFTAIGIEYDCNIADRTTMREGNYMMRTQGGYKDFRTFSSVRIGIETNVSKISLRCGYNHTFPMFRENAAKYLGDTDFNKERMDLNYENIKGSDTFTFGAGYCSKPGSLGQFYVDAAYMYNWRNSELYLGEYPKVDPVTDYQTGSGKLVLTLGVLF